MTVLRAYPVEPHKVDPAVLFLGSDHPDVIVLQAAIRRLGHNVHLSGVYDEATDAILRSWTSLGLSVEEIIVRLGLVVR